MERVSGDSPNDTADEPHNRPDGTNAVVFTSCVTTPSRVAVCLVVTTLTDRNEISEVIPAALTQWSLMMSMKHRTVGAGVWSASTSALLARVVVPLVDSPPPGIPIRRILPLVGVWVVPPSADFRIRSEHHFDTSSFDVFIHKVNRRNTVVRGQSRRKPTH